MYEVKNDSEGNPQIYPVTTPVDMAFIIKDRDYHVAELERVQKQKDTDDARYDAKIAEEQIQIDKDNEVIGLAQTNNVQKAVMDSLIPDMKPVEVALPADTITP